MLTNARTEPRIQVKDQVTIINDYAFVGFASLTIIAIGLIVTWTGYIKGVRWTWFVMFVIVWVWAFPVLVLPLFYPWSRYSWISITQLFANTFASAIHESGIARTVVKVALEFLLMVLALVLPVKALFWAPKAGSRLTVPN